MLTFRTFNLYLLIMIFNLHGSYGYDRTNFHVKRLEHCNPNADYAVKVNATFTTVGNKQYVDGTLITTVPIGSNLRSNFTVEMIVAKNYVYIFSITERDVCHAFHKYMGEFVYDLERRAQIIPGMCPIRKGRYSVHNAPLDYEKITLQTFPFGNLRFTEVATDKQNNVCLCLIIELDNRS